MDSWDNPRVPNSLGWMPSIKQDIANLISTLPEAYIIEFGVAFKNDDVEGMKSSLRRISTALRLLGHDDLAYMMLGSYDAIDESASAESKAAAGMPGSAYRTLNLPMYVNLLNIVDGLGEHIGAREISIVHDEIKEFEESFEFIFDLYRNANPTSWECLDGTIIRIGYKNLSKFRTEASHNSAFVQAADLLATGLRMYSQDAVQGNSWDSNLAEIAQDILPGILCPLQIGSVIGSLAFQRNLLLPALTPLKTMEEDGAISVS